MPRGAVGTTRRWTLVALAAASAVALEGCASGPDPSRAGPEYPAIEPGATLDIQVVRESTVIRLTNTTARSYEDGRLWVNRWYSRPIGRFEVGETLELSLWDFRDQYGEPFQAGGFFSTRKPDKLVIAQLQTGDQLLGLVVVNRGEP